MQEYLYKTKYCIAIALFFLVLMDVNAQQEAKYTEYMFNTLTYNPAYAGTRDAVSGTAIYRHQWANFEGAPRTVSLSVHGPLNLRFKPVFLQEKVGIGLDVQYDSWGVHDWTNIKGNYSYKFYVSPRSKVSIGLSSSLLVQQSNYASVETMTEATDEVFSENVSRVLPNFGLGIFFYSNMYYIGASVPHLLTNDLSALSDEARQFRHYYLAGGLVIPLSDILKLKPAVLVKSVGSFAPTQADISLNLFINDAVWAGIAYRTKDSFDLLLGLQINQGLRLGYAFDLITTDIQNHTDLHTHEFMLGYDFNLRREKIITPRYF